MKQQQQKNIKCLHTGLSSLSRTMLMLWCFLPDSVSSWFCSPPNHHICTCSWTWMLSEDVQLKRKKKIQQRNLRWDEENSAERFQRRRLGLLHQRSTRSPFHVSGRQMKGGEWPGAAQQAGGHTDLDPDHRGGIISRNQPRRIIWEEEVEDF